MCLQTDTVVNIPLFQILIRLWILIGTLQLNEINLHTVHPSVIILTVHPVINPVTDTLLHVMAVKRNEEGNQEELDVESIKN